MLESDTRQRILIGSGLVAILMFFLPWVNQTGFLSGSTSGFDLAKTTESAASGLNLTILFVTPVAALLIIVLSLAVVQRLGVWAPILQMMLAVVAIVPLFTTVPDEISYWSGEAGLAYGAWITVIAMFCVVVAATMSLVVRIQRPRA